MNVMAFCVALLLAANLQGQTIAVKSAEMVLDLGDLLIKGADIDGNKWEELFRSEGYREYLIYSDSLRKKEIIRKTLCIAFDPGRSRELDSMLTLSIKMDANMLELMMVRNFAQLRKNRKAARKFLLQTDFSQVLRDAEALARSYLPSRHSSLDLQLHKVYFVCSDPDGKVTHRAIVLDLNTAMGLGKEDLLKFIAHEYHHNFRAMFVKQPRHPLMIELNKVHQEGMADLIDKPKPPLKKLGFYPRSILDFYNTDFYNTPQVLQQLDGLCSSYLRGELKEKDLEAKLENYFRFGGHSNGYYMSLLIASCLGREVLIDTYDDTLAFIELYNKSARMKEDQHVFSEEFLALVRQASQQK